MTAQMKLSLAITADATGVAPATAEARREISSIGQEAVSTAASLNTFSQAQRQAAANLTNVSNATRLTSNQLLNLSRQGNDVITMWALGVPKMQIFASQAGQIYDVLESGPKGLRGSLVALRTSVLDAGTAFVSFLGPVGLIATGVAAAGAAFVAYSVLTREKVRSIDELLKDHADILKGIEDRYVGIAQAAKGAFSGDTTNGLLLRSANTEAGLKIQIANESQNLFSGIGRFINPGKSAGGFYDVQSEFKPFSEAIEHLRKTAADGSPDILGFRKMVEDRWALDPNNAALTKSAGKLLDLIKLAGDAATALARLGIIQDKLAASKGPGGLPLRGGLLSTENLGTLSQFNASQAVAQARAQAAYDAEVDAIRARSPAEKAAAARAGAAASYNDGESAPERQQRIELAGMRALIAAEHELTEAQRQRQRSLDETIASAQLDVDLVGKSAAEVAGLRMEHQLLAQVRAAADDAGVKADQAEITRIHQKSVEYARLQALQSAREMLNTQSDDLARSRLELVLIGQNSTVRDRLIAQLQTEQEIRRRGIDQYSVEAQLIRANTLEQARNTAQLRVQSEAWDDIRSAGENAIDRLVDSASHGFKDIDDAFSEMGADLLKTALQLSVANPLKNWLFGGDAATISDVGNMGGLVGRLLGRSGDTSTSAISSALGGQSVAAMNVSAAVVNIGGAGIGGAGGLLSQIAGATGDSGGFIGKLGEAIKSVESGGNYSALGPMLKNGDQALGAYQVMKSNLPAWSKQAFGQVLSPGEFLSNPAFQDVIYQQQMGKLLSKFGNSNDAISAWFTGGPLSTGAGRSDILGTTGSAYVNQVNAALSKLGVTTDIANKNMSGFGSGLGQLGNLLSRFPAAPGGGGLMNLFGAGVSAASMAAISPMAAADIASGSWGLFDVGGWTGRGSKWEPAGIVHRDEFVFSSEATRAIGVGNLSALHRAAKRGFAEGGSPMSGMAWASSYSGGGASGGAGGGGDVHVYPPAGVETRTKKVKNTRGGFDTIIVQRQLKQMVADGVIDGEMSNRYGAQTKKARRGTIL